jgi:hypothetical protein
VSLHHELRAASTRGISRYEAKEFKAVDFSLSMSNWIGVLRPQIAFPGVVPLQLMNVLLVQLVLLMLVQLVLRMLVQLVPLAL